MLNVSFVCGFNSARYYRRIKESAVSVDERPRVVIGDSGVLWL